jgi:creatinine amidohydrolase/Fe(II)-dependent formamide hydrolase-like protein
MKRLFAWLAIFYWTTLAWPQSSLSVHWEELTAADFQAAIKQSKGTCLLPFGIIEKHGPHLPLGTDLLDVRYAALHAAEKEYSVVFPEYYFGQIFEAKHEPGTVAYSTHLQLELLQETTDEMARNGCKKVIIVNGHGGNESPDSVGKASRLRRLCSSRSRGANGWSAQKEFWARYARRRIRDLEDADCSP